LADYIQSGPSADEVKRVVMSDVAGRIAGLEQVGGFSGKATTLAEGALYMGTPAHYKREMAELAATTPQSVKTAMQKWLTRPVLALTVLPGARDAYEEAGSTKTARTGIISAPAHYLADGEMPKALPKNSAIPDRSQLPSVGAIPNVDFPAVETATLSNGIKVHYARRDTVPTVRLSVVFNAGKAADPAGKQGTQAMMLAMLKEGTTTRNSIQIAEAQERLGATISVGASMDRTSVSLFALTPNLAPSLDLMADIIQNPAFDTKELERIRNQQLTSIAAEQTSPASIASRTLIPLLYGTDHPYGIGASGSGNPEVVKALTQNDLASFHHKWIRADNAEIFAVGNIPLNKLLPQLETHFTKWKMTRDLPGKKNFDITSPAPAPRIVLVDRPQSPQSMIFAGVLLNAKGTDDLLNLTSANDILGGNFLSRINMDLRETKGWSYGVKARVERNAERAAYLLTAPVQADKTGDSITALRDQITSFLTSKGITPDELARTVNGSVRELPGSYETSDDVLGEMQRSVLYNRPFDYVETLASKIRAQNAESLDTAARKMIDPATLTWVVVGDKAKILPQLQKLALPITVIDSKSADTK
jgi:zinc protease